MNSTATLTFTVQLYDGDGENVPAHWLLTSQDIPGLFLGGTSLEAALAGVSQAADRLIEANHMKDLYHIRPLLREGVGDD